MLKINFDGPKTPVKNATSCRFSIYSEYLCLCDLDLSRPQHAGGASKEQCTKNEKVFAIKGCLTHNHAVEEVPVLVSPDQKQILINMIMDDHGWDAVDIMKQCSTRPDFQGASLSVKYIMILKRAYRQILGEENPGQISAIKQEPDPDRQAKDQELGNSRFFFLFFCCL